MRRRRSPVARRRSGPAAEDRWWDAADQAVAESRLLRASELGRGWSAAAMVNNAERLDPYGDDEDSAVVRAAAQALQGVELRVGDFDWVLAEARPGDFIYFDPPYVPLSPTSSFTSYDRHGFGEEDHRRLAATVHQLTGRGCRVMVSNASAPLVYALYQGHGYQLVEIQARRNINSRGHKRGPVTELLILNGAGAHAARASR